MALGTIVHSCGHASFDATGRTTFVQTKCSRCEQGLSQPAGWFRTEQACGCSLSGRCEQHARMMRAIRQVWDNADNRLCRRIWNKSDGYGAPGFVPPQGYDWSGIRDSSPQGVEAMFAALPN